MKRLEVINELLKSFMPDELGVQVGDFLSVAVDPIDFIRQKQTDYITAHDPREEDMACKRFRRDMLDVAGRMFDAPPAFYPYAAIIAAYLSKDDASDEARAATKALFEQLETNLRAHPKEKQINEIAFESYFCAARLLSFEDSLSQSLYQKADAILFNLLRNDQVQDYYRLITIADHAAIHFPPNGHSFLLANYVWAMDNYSFSNCQAETPISQKVKNLRLMSAVSAGIAAIVADNSILLRPALEQFENHWEALLQLDSAQAIEQLQECVASCQENWNVINPSFAGIVSIKANKYMGSTYIPFKPVRPSFPLQGDSNNPRIARLN